MRRGELRLRGDLFPTSARRSDNSARRWNTAASARRLRSGRRQLPGSAVLGGGDIQVRHATVGRITDLGVTDMTNMGAAMAPAAAQTLLDFF